MKLAINNLTFKYNHHELLSLINFELTQGEILQVNGVNGSGKSTLLRILAGFIEPEIGSIFWNEQCIFKQRESYQRELHYLGHQNGVKPHLTVYENLQLNAALFGKEDFLIEEIAREIDLKKYLHTKTCELSAGQNRRLGLGRFLLRSAKIWILDEPTTSLDIYAEDFLVRMIDKHVEQGGIIIFATHKNLNLKNNQVKILSLRGNNA